MNRENRNRILNPWLVSLRWSTAALASLLVLVGTAGAWDGDLDTTFSADGKAHCALSGFGNGADSAVAVEKQADGTILMAGSHHNGSDYDFGVVRMLASGFLDTSFGQAGRAHFDFDSANDTARDMVIQADGKIVVVGTARVGGIRVLGVVRFHADGSLDDSAIVPFSGTTYGNGVALQPDGKITVCGRTYYVSSGYDFAVARLNSNLTMDTSFGTDGMVDWDFGDQGTDSAAKVAVRDDGKIVVAGTAHDNGQDVFGLMVFSATGGPQGLGMARFTADASGFGLDLQKDGKAVVSGICETNGGDFAVARFNTNSLLDTTFGTGGMATFSHSAVSEESAMDVVVQHNGKVLTTGYLEEGGIRYLAMVRWNSDGTLDWTFNESLFVYTYTDFYTGYDSRGQAIFQQPDGRILAAGLTGYDSGQLVAVARFMGDEDLIFVGDFESSTLNWWSSTSP